MTDLEKLWALLSEWGVGHKDGVGEEGPYIEIRAKDDTLVEGYDGFYALFQFWPDGRFKKIELFE